jgi:hypothetical protein
MQKYASERQPMNTIRCKLAVVTSTDHTECPIGLQGSAVDRTTSGVNMLMQKPLCCWCVKHPKYSGRRSYRFQNLFIQSMFQICATGYFGTYPNGRLDPPLFLEWKSYGPWNNTGCPIIYLTWPLFSPNVKWNITGTVRYIMGHPVQVYC